MKKTLTLLFISILNDFLKQIYLFGPYLNSVQNSLSMQYHGHKLTKLIIFTEVLYSVNFYRKAFAVHFLLNHS